MQVYIPSFNCPHCNTTCSFSGKGDGTATMSVSAANTNQTIKGEKEQFVSELKAVVGAKTYKSKDLILEIHQAVA